MKFFIVSKIEIIDKSTRSYLLTDLNLLFLCWIYFRLEVLSAISSSPSIRFYTMKSDGV